MILLRHKFRTSRTETSESRAARAASQTPFGRFIAPRYEKLPEGKSTALSIYMLGSGTAAPSPQPTSCDS